MNYFWKLWVIIGIIGILERIALKIEGMLQTSNVTIKRTILSGICDGSMRRCRSPSGWS